MSKDVFLAGPGRVEHRDGNTLVSASMEYGEGPRELEVVIRGHSVTVPPPAMGDAILAISLIAAMTTGRRLEVADPVSPRLLRAVDEIQGILHLWYPELTVVPVDAQPVAEGEGCGSGSGAGKTAHFFSGGVDSMHSVAERAGELDALVFVDGADVRTAGPELRREYVARLGAAAAEWELPLIHVESNVGRWARDFGSYGDRFVGARLALVAHLMGERFGEWVVASSSSSRFNPFPSHPVLDPLWSSERVHIRHPLPGRSRAEKILDIAEQEWPLRHLRVCMMGSDYNCGDCPKCRRTLLTLHVIGAVEKAPVFARIPGVDEVLDRQTAEDADVNETEAHYLRETVDLAREIGVEPELVERLARVLRVMESRLLWDRIAKADEEFFEESRWEAMPFESRRRWFRDLLAHNPEWLIKELQAALPGQREAVFACLWKTERRWLRRRLRTASLRRWVRKLGIWRDHSSGPGARL